MDKIKTIDDYAIERAMEFMYEELVKHYDGDIDTLIETIPDNLINVEGRSITDLFFSNEDTVLPQNDALILSRRILSLYTHDQAMVQVAEYALDHWVDNRQSTKVILSSGLIAALLMFMASTSFTIKADWGEIKKEAVTEEQISAVADIIKELANMIKTGDRD